MNEPTVDMIQRLRDGSLVEQQVIIKNISHMNNPLVIPPLINVLTQEKEELIEEVAEAFYQLREYMPEIIKTEILNQNFHVRLTIIWTIEKLGGSVYIPNLIEAIGIGYKPVVDKILELLVNIDPVRFRKPKRNLIFSILTENEKKLVLKQTVNQLGAGALDITETIFALRTLQYLEFRPSILPLLKARHHPDFRVQQESYKILHRNFDEAIIFETSFQYLAKYAREMPYDFTLPGNENYPIHVYLIESLGEISDRNKVKKSRKYLWNVMRHGTYFEKIYSIKALGTLNTRFPDKSALNGEIKKEIKILLNSCESSMRLSFIQTLGNLGEEWITECISGFIEDNSPNVRLAVINTLSRSNAYSENILEKAAILLTDRNIQIRRAALSLYWKLEPKYFGRNEGDIISEMPEDLKLILQERLLDGLINGNDQYKKFAAFWLSIHRYQPAYTALINNLQHTTDEVKIGVIVSLGLFGDNRAIPHLIPLMYNESKMVKKKSIETIGSLGLDGLHELIHQLYQDEENPLYPEFLEVHILTFGGRILNYISKEIESEANSQRKARLQELYEKTLEHYNLKSADDFTILL